MAKAYQCDRCGAFFTRGEYCGKYHVTLKMCENPEDLCPQCGKELEKWMANEADFGLRVQTVPKYCDNKKGEKNDILENICYTGVSDTDVN